MHKLRNKVKTEKMCSLRCLKWILLLGYVVSIAIMYTSDVYFYSLMSRFNQAVRNMVDLNQLFLPTMIPLSPMTMELQYILKEEIHNRSSPNACPWPPRQLYGRQPLNKTVYSFKQLAKLYPFMENGHYQPDCEAYQKIAIVVPYRDRKKQLKIFFNNVLPRIHRQKQDFTVYIVEQADQNPFNRGMLVNIGYAHAIKEAQFDCIIIHDVDILPEDDRNLYFCNNSTAYHLAGRMQRAKYTLPYPGFAGAIASLSTHQYKVMNGFSNLFFGWGGEDDDFKRRLNNAGYKLGRPLETFSHCGDVQHTREKPARHRFAVLSRVEKKWRSDGLNTLTYNLIQKQKRKLYVWIYVSIDMKILYESGLHIRGYDRKGNEICKRHGMEYADDTQVYMVVSPKDMANYFESVRWITRNKLNEDKTELIIISQIHLQWVDVNAGGILDLEGIDRPSCVVFRCWHDIPYYILKMNN